MVAAGDETRHGAAQFVVSFHGHVDDVMVLVIRARRGLGVEPDHDRSS